MKVGKKVWVVSADGKKCVEAKLVEYSKGSTAKVAFQDGNAREVDKVRLLAKKPALA